MSFINLLDKKCKKKNKVNKKDCLHFINKYTIHRKYNKIHKQKIVNHF